MEVKSAKNISKIKEIMKEFWKKKINFKKIKPLSVKHLWFYIETNKEFIGFINGCLLDYGFNKEAMIDNLYINESFRGKGYSKKLLQKFISHCKSVTNYANKKS